MTDIAGNATNGSIVKKIQGLDLNLLYKDETTTTQKEIDYNNETGNVKWVPLLNERKLIYAMHEAITNIGKRIDLINDINVANVDKIEWRLNQLSESFDFGYYRFGFEYKKMFREFDKKIKKPLNTIINKYEKLNNDIMFRQFIEWKITYNVNNIENDNSNNDEDTARGTEYNISKNEKIQENSENSENFENVLNGEIINTDLMRHVQWPDNIESPTNQVGNVLWYAQCRLIAFENKNDKASSFEYKLGLFIGPKFVKNWQNLVDLNAKLQVWINIKFKKDNQQQMMQENVKFDINANFLKEGEIMLWGKFIPELQMLIDENSGMIQTDDLQMTIKFRVVNQTLAYKNSHSSKEYITKEV